ncbi:hypothetical protein GCM10022252_79110 [Streptosporangium oxazolinicum]|uniref:Uncharacterized protein n=1 Tax=Streptosporangium oxazolinicum TaxID=909287 RepID=A0ABP8BMZ2_9ACTN
MAAERADPSKTAEAGLPGALAAVSRRVTALAGGRLVNTDEQLQQVPASRRRGGLAATRSDHQESERSFFCRVCQRAERGVWVPTGWYLLERAGR